MRILLAAEFALFRSSLRSLLESRAHVVVGEAGDGRSAIEMATSLLPDLMLTDLQLPEIDGLEATRQLKELMPELKVVIVTTSDKDEDLVAALRAGARGYLLPSLEPDTFFNLLDRAEAGELALPPELLTRAVEALCKGRQTRALLVDPTGLTQPEREVLDLMVEGFTATSQIARHLELSESTVDSHVRNLLGKLPLTGRSGAIFDALRPDPRDSGLAPVPGSAGTAPRTPTH